MNGVLWQWDKKVTHCPSNRASEVMIARLGRTVLFSSNDVDRGCTIPFFKTKQKGFSSDKRTFLQKFKINISRHRRNKNCIKRKFPIDVSFCQNPLLFAPCQGYRRCHHPITGALAIGLRQFDRIIAGMFWVWQIWFPLDAFGQTRAFMVLSIFRKNLTWITKTKQA